MNMSPLLTKSFMGLRYSTLNYLPQFFNPSNPVLRSTIPSAIFNSIGDYNFLRNAGFCFPPLVAILIIWGIVKLLTIEELNRWKNIRLWFRSLL